MKPETLIGSSAEAIAKELGLSLAVVKDRLNKAGYGISNGVIFRRQTAQELQDEIRARIAATPEPGPCPRCAARGACPHRPYAADRELAA